MELTLDYILDNLIYELVADDRIKYVGNLEYVSSHFGDCNTSNTLTIATSQKSELQGFVDSYFKAQEFDPNLTIEEFYNESFIIA